MRSLWAVLLLAASLSGCLGGDAPGPDGLDSVPAPGPAPLDAPVDMGGGTATWHHPDTQDELFAYGLAAQTVANPCIFQNSDDEEVYFNNLDVGTHLGIDRVPAGAGGLEMTVSWTQADYLGDALYLAHKPSDGERWHVSKALPNGEATVVPIPPTERATHYGLWLCVSGDDTLGTPSEGPKVFDGDVTLAVRAVSVQE